MYPRNAASPERIAVGQVVLIADGTVQTSGVSITVRPQGGAEAAGGGTTAYGAEGTVYYTPTQAETNYTSFVVIAYKASCFSVSQTVITTASATPGKVVLSGETHTSAVIPTVTDVTNLHASAATAAAQTTAQNDLDIITGTDGVTLATAQALYAPSKAGDAMTLTAGERTAIVDEWETQSQADPTGFHVNLMEVDGNANIMRKLKEYADASILFSDTAQAGGASTITLAAGTSVSDDDLKDYAIYLNGGTGAGQFARIESVVAATQVATINTPVNGWATAPDATTTYVILSAGSIVHVSSLHAAALTEITNELDANSTLSDWVDGGRLDLIVDAILTDTAEIGAAGAGLTAVPWNPAWDVEVQSECADALTAYDPPTKTELDSAFTEIKGATWSSGTDTLEHIRDKQTDVESDTQDIQSRLPAALSGGNMACDILAISTSSEAADKLEASAETMEIAAAAAGTLSTTQMTTTLTEATNDHYNGRVIIWTSGALLRQATDITDYDGTTKMLTFTAVTEAPGDGDTFIIV